MKEKKSAYNEKHNQYTQNYIKANYKQLSVRIPIYGDMTRDRIAKAAAAAGKSVYSYILDAVENQIKVDQDGQDIPPGIIPNLIKWLRNNGMTEEQTTECIEYICSEHNE